MRARASAENEQKFFIWTRGEGESYLSKWLDGSPGEWCRGSRREIPGARRTHRFDSLRFTYGRMASGGAEVVVRPGQNVTAGERCGAVAMMEPRERDFGISEGVTRE